MAEQAPVPEPRPGDVVDGRYRLLRVVAEGGMGVVFEASRARSASTVAIKLLHAGFQYRDDVRQRLLREADALELARHPGVVGVVDAGTCAIHGVFLVTEMLRGRPLDGLLAARGRLGIAETVAIGIQLAAALAHAHRRGVVHRDLKPGNVFVSRDRRGGETITLIDFGIARLLAEPGAAGAAKITHEGEVLGTIDYMAPEQLTGRDVSDPRCDVYGLAATLHECLTGVPPRTGSYEERMRELAEDRVGRPDVRARRPEVPATLAAAIERALAARLADRTPDCDTLGTELAELAELASIGRPSRPLLLGPVSDAPPPPAAPPPSRESAVPLLLERKQAEAPIPLQRRQSAEPLLLEKRAGDEPIPLAAARRKHPRAPYVTPLTITTPGGAIVSGRTEDISEGGILALLDAALIESTEVRLRFALPLSGEIVELAAKVSWTRAARGKRHVAGLAFAALPAPAAAKIHEYIALASFLTG